MNVILKTEFDKTPDNKGLGVMTDGNEKLNVILEQYDSKMNYEKGEHFKLCGKFIKIAHQLHVLIFSMSRIEKEKMSIKDLRQIIKVAKRTNSSASPITSKVIIMISTQKYNININSKEI